MGIDPLSDAFDMQHQLLMSPTSNPLKLSTDMLRLANQPLNGYSAVSVKSGGPSGSSPGIPDLLNSRR